MYPQDGDGRAAAIPELKTLDAFEKVPGSAAHFAAAQYAYWQTTEHQQQLAATFAGR